jgi:outer membrane protein insertion porin family
VSEVAIVGNASLSTEELLGRVKLKVGETYSRQTERDDQTAISDRYNRDGFLDCRVRGERLPDSQTLQVAVTYHVTEGVASTIRNINIAGNRVTQDRVIRRELEILPGEKSDGTKIRASKDRLNNLGYFAKVDIVPVSTETPTEKDLKVEVEEKETGRLMLGAGFSSADDLFGTVELAQSNFDWENPPTFRGAGQRFRLRAAVGTSRTDYTLSFTEPWLFDRKLRLDWELWQRTVSSHREWEQESFGTSASLTKQLPWDYWRQTVGYRIEQIKIKDIDEDFSRAFRDYEEGSELVSAASYGVSRDHRNRAVNPSSGSTFRARTELQSEAIGSYTNLYKLTLEGAKYYPILKDSIVKLEGEATQVAKISGDDPRVFDRLFAGGLGSIRGFRERSVGPYDPKNEEAIGGASRLTLTGEYLKPLYEENVYFALWTDAGNVWDSEWGYGSGLNVGSGVGLRLFLPVGAFQFDYGWPIVRDQDNLGTSGRFHFSLGYTF